MIFIYLSRYKKINLTIKVYYFTVILIKQITYNNDTILVS